MQRSTLIATIGLFALAFLAIAAVVRRMIMLSNTGADQQFLAWSMHAIVNFSNRDMGPVAGFFEEYGIFCKWIFTDVWNSIWEKTVSVWNSILNFFSGLASSVGDSSQI